jgi:hypothetical protein
MKGVSLLEYVISIDKLPNFGGDIFFFIMVQVVQEEFMYPEDSL